MSLLTRIRAAWNDTPTELEMEIRAQAFKDGVAVGDHIGFERGVMVGGQEMLRRICLDREAYLPAVPAGKGKVH